MNEANPIRFTYFLERNCQPEVDILGVSGDELRIIQIKLVKSVQLRFFAPSLVGDSLDPYIAVIRSELHKQIESALQRTDRDRQSFCLPIMPLEIGSLRHPHHCEVTSQVGTRRRASVGWALSARLRPADAESCNCSSKTTRGAERTHLFHRAWRKVRRVLRLLRVQPRYAEPSFIAVTWPLGLAASLQPSAP